MTEKINFAITILSSIVILSMYIIGGFRPNKKFIIVFTIGVICIALIFLYIWLSLK